ncbi:YabP family protein [Ruminococcaceae bacterium FB2012]|nr:YabP family protein [Ruminococcaceae bacterium FB2012]
MGRYTDKLADAAGGFSYITITSDKSVMIEGCRQIIECSEILARIATRQFTVEIWGSGLTVDSFSNSSVRVSGRIGSLSLEKRRRSDAK